MPTILLTCGLLSLLVPLSWHAETGITYTIQQSTNLSGWDAMSMVISGADREESIVLEIPGSPAFARLRFSSDGDTNNNGLPDLWEWSQFGYLDVDPSADPDLDGRSNLEEWTAETDPQDYFDGEIPILKLTCGKEWLVSPGEVSVQAVSLYLRHPSGDPWPNAPVLLHLRNGLGSLSTGEGSDSDSLVVFTDSLGRVHQGLDPVHYQSPESGSQSEILDVSAGRAHETLIIRTISSAVGGPPRNLIRLPQTNNRELFKWNGNSSEADSFRLEKQTDTGEWVAFIELAISELPDADPDSGIYSLITEMPLIP